MKIGIMQPYIFPYIGYWQLINAVDKFIVYDNIKLSKGGWINRNRILLNGRDIMISVPIKSESDFLDIYQRRLADSYLKSREKIKNQLEAAYFNAPNFLSVIKLIHECLDYPDLNLFNFILNSINLICKYLYINTEILISSQIPANHYLKSRNRVIDICTVLGADQYINAIGGMDIYDKNDFEIEGIKLNFIRTNSISYFQGNENLFIPNLSIIDVMMFNTIPEITKMLDAYELI